MIAMDLVREADMADEESGFDPRIRREMEAIAAHLDMAEAEFDSRILALSMIGRAAKLFKMMVKAGVVSSEDVESWWSAAHDSSKGDLPEVPKVDIIDREAPKGRVH